MPELRLQRNAGILIVELGDHSASVPLERVLPTPNLWQQSTFLSLIREASVLCSHWAQSLLAE